MGHCPYRYAEMLQNALASSKMRVAFLLGAGCPMSIRVSSGTETKPLIPDIQALTDFVKSEIEKAKDTCGCFTTLNKLLEHFPERSEPNVEIILSHIRLLIEVIKKDSIDNLSKGELVELDRLICSIITECVKAEIPEDQLASPYHQFANWVNAIPMEYAVEIFTTNYDLLMERALEDLRVPYFDGFIGSNRAFFDLSSIEHDKLPSRWARLWKLHGSINWWRTKGEQIERKNVTSAEEQQMIYPSHLKYDQSRRLPYLAMLDRLKAFLSPGKGPAVIVTCGYSFADEHLNELIQESLRGNPAAVCYALLFGNKDQPGYNEARDCAKRQPNLRILSQNGAIIGTREALWSTETKEQHPLSDFIAVNPDFEGNTELETHRVNLGDFAAFGKFLIRQCESHAPGDNLIGASNVTAV